jgi:hypothetical protein
MAPRGSQPLRIVGLLKAVTVTFVSRTQNTHGRGEPYSPRPFCWVRPARIAIASELLERLQRVQQDDRGAQPVADGEWRVAMSADSSRVFPWPERSRWRAQWGSEWPERLPVLRPLLAPALPIA